MTSPLIDTVSAVDIRDRQIEFTSVIRTVEMSAFFRRQFGRTLHDLLAMFSSSTIKLERQFFFEPAV